jgi:hypothetical protein
MGGVALSRLLRTNLPDTRAKPAMRRVGTGSQIKNALSFLRNVFEQNSLSFRTMGDAVRARQILEGMFGGLRIRSGQVWASWVSSPSFLRRAC